MKKVQPAGLRIGFRSLALALSCVLGAALQAPLAFAEPSAPPVDKDWSRLMEALQKAGDHVDSKLPPGVTDQDLADNTLVKLGAFMSGYLTVTQSDPD